MPRAAQKQLEYDGDAIDTEFEDRTRQAEDERDEIEEITSAIDQSENDVVFTISVSRHTGTRFGGAWCFDCTPAEFKHVRARLADECGPGVYVAKVKRNGKFFRKLIIEIDKSAVKTAAQGQISELANVIKQSQEQTAALLAGRTTPTSTDPNSSMIPLLAQMMQQQAQAQTQIILALLTREVPAPRGPMDDLKGVAGILEIAREIGGGERGDRNLVDLAESFFRSPIAERVANALPALSPPTVPANSVRALPNSVTPPANQPISPAPLTVHPLVDAMDPALKAQIAGVLGFWIARAQKGSDPALYAHVALDTIDEALISAIVLRDDLHTIAAAINPAALPVWPWIESLIAEIRAIREGDLDDSDEFGDEDAGPGAGELESGAAPLVSSPDDISSRPADVAADSGRRRRNRRDAKGDARGGDPRAD